MQINTKTMQMQSLAITSCTDNSLHKFSNYTMTLQITYHNACVNVVWEDKHLLPVIYSCMCCFTTMTHESQLLQHYTIFFLLVFRDWKVFWSITKTVELPYNQIIFLAHKFESKIKSRHNYIRLSVTYCDLKWLNMPC